ncbi:PAS domain S-box protein [Ramlibacter sp. WS9]|uniref:sensor histidine kinase n=1 Tax=Ramlibacter sp. WS9 TaxID=1882741 RepID=UPI0011441161|nr:PAS domain S-box protein [Ramlibacter sp. WS9]ROZ72339.1 PAS domain S-box protein [Ramlibacter sp. WS9]
MLRTFGLRAALTLLVLIAIAPVFGIVVQASLSEQRSRVERAEGSLRSVVDLADAQQERFIDGARQVLAAMAHSPPLYGEDAAACAAYLKRLQQEYPVTYGAFGLLDTQGQLTCRATAPATPVNSSDRLFFRKAIETGRFSVGEFTLSRASGRAVLTFGLPVYRNDESRSLRGVAYLAMDVAQAHDHLRKLALMPEMTLFVADRNGVVIAASGAKEVRVGSPLPEPFLRQAIARGQPRFERGTGADGAEWLYAVRPVGRADEGLLHVAAMVSSADLLAPATQRLHQQLGALIVIALLAGAAAWVFGDRIVVRPVARMLQRVDALRREESALDGSVPPGGLLELRELEERFQDMARGLAERSIQRDGAMAEMAAQKTLLGSIFDSMAEGVLVVGRDGRFNHINAAAHAIMPGLAQLNRQADPVRASAEEWGVYHLDGVTPMDPEGRPALRALSGENLDNFRYVIRGRLSGGPDKIIQGHTRTLMSPQGERDGAVLVFADISAAYRAEQALKDSEQRYRALFESNPHPMWVYDLETLRFLTVNDSAVAHYGYSRDEFLAMTIKDIRPAEDVQALLAAVDGNDGLRTLEPWKHRLRDGRLIYVEISSHTLDYGGRRARMVLAHDITERRLAQQALEHINETLERRVGERTRELDMSNRELESFSYSVSHDLRAPLQVIDGFGRALVARYSQALDQQARHYLDRIRDNTRQMGELIDDLLSLARVTRTEIRAEPVNLAPKATQIIERLRQRWPDRQVAVEIDEDMSCSGDARLLAVVLENLIENAWKFTARTQGARIRIGRKAGEAGENVIYVSDNGAGFDMAYAAKLFNAFQRLHAASEFDGTGIGLATVHRIITRHGGRVWAEASLGQGATFQFTLKAVKHEEQPHPAGRRQSGPSGADPDDTGREQCAQ